MGHHHDRHAQGFVELADEIHDLSAGAAVEIAGGFVRQQKLRLIDQSSSQCCTLLFAAGKFAGPVRHARAEADSFQRLAVSAWRLAAIDFGKTQRQVNILRQRHSGDQIERLKNHADGAQAMLGQILARELGQVTVLDDDRSRSWTVEAGDQVQQGRFAGAGTAEQSNKFSRANLEGDAVNSANQRCRPSGNGGKDRRCGLRVRRSGYWIVWS